MGERAGRPVDTAVGLDDPEALLRQASMSFANLMRLDVCTTGVDLLSQRHGGVGARLGAARVVA